MKRIYLTKREKEIINLLNKKEYSYNFNDKFYISQLESKDMCTSNCVGYNDLKLSDKCKVYLKTNPKLKNPSVWEDRKFVINTTISLVALIVSIVAICLNIFK